MSTTTLALVSTLLPAMVILTTQCMVRYRKKESSVSAHIRYVHDLASYSPRIYSHPTMSGGGVCWQLLDYLVPYLALCESIVLTNLVGETLKHYASDLRPNFLARCNYKGMFPCVECALKPVCLLQPSSWHLDMRINTRLCCLLICLGYRDAVASGNYTAYNAVTVAGQLGSYAFCLDTQVSRVTFRIT